MRFYALKTRQSWNVQITSMNKRIAHRCAVNILYPGYDKTHLTRLQHILLQPFGRKNTHAVDLVDFATGLVKACAYGVIVAVSGCLRGMQSGRSAAAVGEAATSAVVTGIVFIVVCSATLTVIYQILGI